jgi:sugar lactone lactonase YvrE
LAFFLAAGASAGGQTSSPPYYFTTLAGVASVGSADGPGSDARFNFPTGLSLDAAGNLYVADTLNFTVRRITPAGLVSTVAGRAGESRDVDGPGASARFRNVQAVAADRQGNVFVAEGRVIRRIAPDGMVTTLAGYFGDGYLPPSSVDGTGTLARFNSLTGLVVDAGGTLFASDGGGNTIRQITSAGVVTTLAGSGSPGGGDGSGLAAGFAGPAGLAVDSGGAVYVADSGNNTIRKILAGGTVMTLAGRASTAGFADGVGAGALFNAPHGVAVDAGGKVYVADYFNEAVRGVTPAGQVTTLAGRPPANGNPAQVGSADGTGAAAAFNSPSGLVADLAGNVYVADSGNNTIRKVTPAGLVTTVAGFPSDQAVGAVDGSGPAARFNYPSGIAVTSDGTCYVADSGNHLIRKISPEGIVTTLAGMAGKAGYADGAGAATRFNGPGGLALDAAGNLYVIESDNSTVRKITPAGVVSTVAGVGGTSGQSIDGLGPINGYSRTTCIAVGPAGLVYVGEMGMILHPEYY